MPANGAFESDTLAATRHRAALPLTVGQLTIFGTTCYYYYYFMLHPISLALRSRSAFHNSNTLFKLPHTSYKTILIAYCAHD